MNEGKIYSYVCGTTHIFLLFNIQAHYLTYKLLEKAPEATVTSLTNHTRLYVSGRLSWGWAKRSLNKKTETQKLDYCISRVWELTDKMKGEG